MGIRGSLGGANLVQWILICIPPKPDGWVTMVLICLREVFGLPWINPPPVWVATSTTLTKSAFASEKRLLIPHWTLSFSKNQTIAPNLIKDYRFLT